MADALCAEGLVIEAGPVRLVDGVDLRVCAGEILALVGASGAGKTLVGRALVGLVQARPGLVAGDVALRLGEGWTRPLRAPDPAACWAGLRGSAVAWLPQGYSSALDPTRSVGAALRAVSDADPARWLGEAGFTEPASALRLYPHQLSGGMAQRVGVALALARGARFLIADEPTTGLDPTTRYGVHARLRRLADQGAGVLLITHDLRVVPRWCDQVVVLHQGRVAEALPAAALREARSPEARALLTATAAVSGAPL